MKGKTDPLIPSPREESCRLVSAFGILISSESRKDCGRENCNSDAEKVTQPSRGQARPQVSGVQDLCPVRWTTVPFALPGMTHLKSIAGRSHKTDVSVGDVGSA